MKKIIGALSALMLIGGTANAAEVCFINGTNHEIYIPAPIYPSDDAYGAFQKSATGWNNSSHYVIGKYDSTEHCIGTVNQRSIEGNMNVNFGGSVSADPKGSAFNFSVPVNPDNQYVASIQSNRPDIIIRKVIKTNSRYIFQLDRVCHGVLRNIYLVHNNPDPFRIMIPEENSNNAFSVASSGGDGAGIKLGPEGKEFTFQFSEPEYLIGTICQSPGANNTDVMPLHFVSLDGKTNLFTVDIPYATSTHADLDPSNQNFDARRFHVFVKQYADGDIHITYSYG